MYGKSATTHDIHSYAWFSTSNPYSKDKVAFLYLVETRLPSPLRSFVVREVCNTFKQGEIGNKREIPNHPEHPLICMVTDLQAF
jgi:hypothetical protein